MNKSCISMKKKNRQKDETKRFYGWYRDRQVKNDGEVVRGRKKAEKRNKEQNAIHEIPCKIRKLKRAFLIRREGNGKFTRVYEKNKNNYVKNGK